MRFSLLALVAALAPSALADVKITQPASGASVAPGAVTVVWAEGSGSPALSMLTSFTLQLMVGGNTDTDSKPVATTQGAFAGTTSVVMTVDPGVAGPTPNGFYFKMQSVTSDGGIVINFSDRIDMPLMKGTTDPQFATAAAALGGARTARPTVNNVNQPAAAAGGAANGQEASTPYNSQTGLTKYAPMQPIPPTKITANVYTPLFPTSAFTIATTWVAHPSIVTTITASQTWSVSSMENTAAPQSIPTGDMAKFLARWKD